MISQVSLKGLFGQQAKVAHCMTGILLEFPTLFAASFASRSIWINSQAYASAGWHVWIITWLCPMSIDNDCSLNCKLCTYNQDDVAFYYVNSHKAGWRAHKYLQNSEIIILWMQQTNPKHQSEWPWSRTGSYIVFTSGWQGWQGSSAKKNNSQTISLGTDQQWTSVTSSQHPRDYLKVWVAPMCTTSKPFNKRITA